MVGNFTKWRLLHLAAIPASPRGCWCPACSPHPGALTSMGASAGGASTAGSCGARASDKWSQDPC